MKKKKYWKRAVAVISAIAIVSSGSAPVNVYAKESNVRIQANTMNQIMKLWYDSPADINSAGGGGGKWMQESLPLGNGNLGNLIFGGITKERIHFNEKTLWTGTTKEGGNKPTAYTAEEIETYRQELDDKSKTVFPHAREPVRFIGGDAARGSYQDFGDIWLDYSPMHLNESAVKNYRRELDLATGIAQTKFDYKNVTYTRDHFVSYPDNVMVTELSASQKDKLSVDISMRLSNSGLDGQVTMDEKNNSCTIAGIVKNNGLKFRTTMKIVPENGAIEADKKNQVFHVKDADRIQIIMAAETDYLNDYPEYRDKNKDLAKVVDGRVNKCADMKYEELRQHHLKDHQGMFDRVSLDLGERLPNIPTDELVRAYRKGEYSTYLEVLAFQYGRYLSIAGSRGTLPSNLVGLWTLGNAAWAGDYHFNINIQMNYWPVYVTNLAECGTLLVEYMDNLREPGRVTAERVHGIENATTEHTGFTVHTSNGPFGMTIPSGDVDWAWNPTGAAWTMQNLWQHYEFTENETYLREKIYPIMKEAALFWDHYLWESKYQKIDDNESPYHGQNRLVVAPSYSAEQGPTCVGSTYDQSLVWELYKECIAAGKIVGEDQALLDKWQNEMDRLDPINISGSNGIKEWYEETRVGIGSNGHNQSFAQAGDLQEIEVPASGWNHGHPGEQRHASHLVGLYPGTLINKENPEYLAAAKQSLGERGFYSTGWSKANKINLWARTGNGDNAYKTLNNLIGGNTAGLQYNLFDSHGTGGGETMLNGSCVWQIDGNYGLTAGVAEMLVQSQLGYTQFLPAVPKAWENGEVQGLKARGNFTIGEKWMNGTADTFTVCYEGANDTSEFTGEYAGITNAKVFADGKEVQVTKNEEKGQITFKTVKNKVYTIDFQGVYNQELIEKAEAFLEQIHPDLAAAKEELKGAIEANSSDLGIVLSKVQVMDKAYRKYLEDAENIYYMTDQDGLTEQEIDRMYVEMSQIREALIKNTEDANYYENAYSSIKEIGKTLKEQMHDREIVFSRKTGVLTEDERLTLSKSERADKYDIRYTLDGTDPGKAAELYKDSILLKKEGGNQTVKAALFFKEQRVSPIYTEKYVTEGVEVNQVDVSFKNTWGTKYAETKMIDGDANTRWAAKDTAEPIDVTLKFEKSIIDCLNFDLYVSKANSIGAFVVQAKTEAGEYKTIFETEKMGDWENRIEKLPDGNGEGYHAYFDAKFPKIETSELKIHLQSFTKGPSFYEVKPLFLGLEKEAQGNPAGLNAMLELAKAVDREAEDYKSADEDLKAAFERSILDAEEILDLTQAKLDCRELFLKNRYERLGYGEVNKEPLRNLAAKAEEMLVGNYTKDSLYDLKKAIGKAKIVLEDEGAKQPAVEVCMKELETAISSLEEAVNEIVEEIPIEKLEGGWRTSNGFRFSTTIGDPLTYEFQGCGVIVKSITARDHGKLKVVLTNTDTNEEVFNKTIDTYSEGERQENVVIVDETLPNGNYKIQFEKAGEPKYVEVKLSIKKPFTETVDRSLLEREVSKCQKLQSDIYTEKSWMKLQEVLKQAEEVLGKKDQDTCTAEMNDVAEQLEAARDALVVFEIVSLKEVSVLTEAGTKPEMPEVVRAVGADGTEKNVMVIWNEISADQYAEKGEFTVEGSVNETELKAKCLVTVTLDISGLETKIAEAKAIQQEQPDFRYGKQTWETLQNVIRDVEKQKDAAKTKADVEGAITALQTAIDGLKKEAALVLENLKQTEGYVTEVVVVTEPEDLEVKIYYDGEETLPMKAGEYKVKAVIMDKQYEGEAFATLIIEKEQTESEGKPEDPKDPENPKDPEKPTRPNNSKPKDPEKTEEVPKTGDVLEFEFVWSSLLVLMLGVGYVLWRFEKENKRNE